VKPYDQGRESFIRGKLVNPYKIDTRPNKDWEFGFNTEYFKNLEKVKQYEQLRAGSQEVHTQEA